MTTWKMNHKLRVFAEVDSPTYGRVYNSRFKETGKVNKTNQFIFRISTQSVTKEHLYYSTTQP